MSESGVPWEGQAIWEWVRARRLSYLGKKLADFSPSHFMELMDQLENWAYGLNVSRLDPQGAQGWALFDRTLKVCLPHVSPEFLQAHAQGVLQEAVRRPDEKMVACLLDAGMSVEGHPCKTNQSRTPLSFACQTPNALGVVKLLLARGADIHHRALNGMTPLMEAASLGDWPIMEYLVEQGADLASLDDYDRSAADLAIKYDFSDGVPGQRFLDSVEVCAWLVARGCPLPPEGEVRSGLANDGIKALTILDRAIAQHRAQLLENGSPSRPGFQPKTRRI